MNWNGRIRQKPLSYDRTTKRMESTIANEDAKLIKGKKELEEYQKRLQKPKPIITMRPEVRRGGILILSNN